MIELLRDLRKIVVTGFVGGSDLTKIQEQLGVTGNNGAKPLFIATAIHYAFSRLVRLTYAPVQLSMISTSHSQRTV